ncbi:sensor histidine kinase [Dyadobacter aurulentus]|uniref:sensor histidine kinase n=1 Tax=Dyadobacter sp. UC 10 TaxID=2605428 RepID=UPI001788CA12|nr:sensor histidine kinase [Dyadobacter sp. UC 10]
MSRRFGLIDKYSDSLRRNRLHYIICTGVMVCLLPVVGFALWGNKFFSDPAVMVGGSILNLFFCLTAYLLNLSGSRLVPAIYPDTYQSIHRVAFWFGLYVVVNITLLTVSLALYHFFHVFGYQFEKVTASWLALSLLAGSLVTAGLTELFYAFEQWKTNQHELQQLEHKQLQTELEVVKQQVNPHFLFNCLNSLSVLIYESPDVAEKFVDEMSQVYRYLLNVNAPDKEDSLVTLETEVRFVKSYIYLLKTRFEHGIDVTVQIAEVYLSGQLAPLTLQTLLDNAIRHNIVSSSLPLRITIRTTPTGQLEVFNNMQKRVIGIPFGNAGLATLISRYRLLFNQAGTIQIREEGGFFTVTLPLIYT